MIIDQYQQRERESLWEFQQLARKGVPKTDSNVSTFRPRLIETLIGGVSTMKVSSPDVVVVAYPASFSTECKLCFACSHSQQVLLWTMSGSQAN